MATKKQTRLREQYDEAEIDPFSAPPAGFGLTTPPGQWNWEQPPEHVDLETAFQEIKGKMMVPETRMTMLQLMDAGMPIETLVRTITFVGFSQGKFTPDLAEMLNPLLSMYLTVIADKAGITPRLLNNPPPSSIDPKTVMTIMKDLNPDRYVELLNRPFEDEEEEGEPEKDEQDKTPKNFMEMEA